MKVICDSTVIIGFAKIGRIHLLKDVFNEVYIPDAVHFEVVVKGNGRPGVKEVESAAWIHRRKIRDTRNVEMLVAEIGRGEAEVLVLGKELNADWLIIDDERARTAAISAGFHVIGLVGILLLAKQLNLLPSIKSLLDELRDKNFRLSDKICEEALKRVGE